MSPGQALIRASGQGPRFYVAMLFFFAAALVYAVVPFLYGKVNVDWLVGATMGATVVGFVGMFLLVTIKCPRCNARWFWLMASKRHDDPQHWTMLHSECSICVLGDGSDAT